MRTSTKRYPAVPTDPLPDPVVMAVRVKRAAQMLSISERKTWSLIAKGELPVKRTGGLTLVLISGIRAWLAGTSDAA